MICAVFAKKRDAARSAPQLKRSEVKSGANMTGPCAV
jgi:hypothetical protein